MPIAIFVYEIEEGFGPKLISDYFITNDKFPLEVLKELTEKHTKLADAVVKVDDLRYYSSIIQRLQLPKSKAYLGFALKKGEDILTLKGFFEKLEETIVKDYDKLVKDRKLMQNVLKNGLSSIMSLLEKLREPKIIKETINERTKKMLDEGKTQDAIALIDLGNKIPAKLSDETKIAEQLFKEKQFKKSAKSYTKAAELAAQIGETDMVSFLKNKSDQIAKLPDLIKERESINVQIGKISTELDKNQLELYAQLIPLIDKLITLATALEEEDAVDRLSELKNYCLSADKKASELSKFYQDIKELMKQI